MPVSFDDLREAFDVAAASLIAKPGEEGRSPKAVRILASATELFVQRGYRKTSVDEIAERAQVAKGTVYLHFTSKADLLMQAVVEEKGRYLGRIRPAFSPQLDPVERLRVYVACVVEMASEMPITSRLLSGDREVSMVIDELDPDLVEQSRRARLQFLTVLLQEAAPGRFEESELEERAALLIAVMEAAGFFVKEETRGGLSVPRFAQLWSTVLIDGLLAECVERRPALAEITV